MTTSRILTDGDMAGLLQVDVGVVWDAYRRGDLPGFEIGPGHLRCSEPAFHEWAERKSREADGGGARADAVEAAYAASDATADRFAVLATPGGPLPSLAGAELSTPDARRSRPFRLDHVDPERGGLQITPLGNGDAAPLWLRGEAVNRCLYFLETQVPAGEPIPIQASQNHPGPLARFTRRGNGGVRCLPYLLPILERCGLVVIDGDARPNTVRTTTADDDEVRHG